MFFVLHVAIKTVDSRLVHLVDGLASNPIPRDYRAPALKVKTIPAWLVGFCIRNIEEFIKMI